MKPSRSTSQSFETSSSNIIPNTTPSGQQVQQEQDHLLHPPVAASPPPINPSNIELPPVVDTQPIKMTQPVNNLLVSQQYAQNQQQLVNLQQQLFCLQNQQFVSQPYRLPDRPNSWSSITTQPVGMDFRAEQEAQRLHNEMILQENRARNKYRIYIQQRALNKAQKFLMDGMLMNLEARNKGFDNPSYNPFGNFQPSFNSNQYIDNLSQILSQDQQDYFNNSDEYLIQRDEDHDSTDDAFGEVDLIQLQVRGHRGRVKKGRGRDKAQSQTPPLLSSHRPIQESMQSKLKVPGQRRGKTGAASGTKNTYTQSSRKIQITGGSDFNFGSSTDIDMEQMMEMDPSQTQSTTDDVPIVSTAPLQLETA
ncbi:MAG: hypothetical protein EZS28_036710 [Streblomastix strix]|uniref:Uncharacterized protein n=1 Tax=Streblomastix strix TaxID=222440 RepID=A0A5J4UDU8_9EUKA|nr:MAG: hypothetical protein EZS28_036710 [Streblomastix strix]